jgi:hypothetical protein
MGQQAIHLMRAFCHSLGATPRKGTPKELEMMNWNGVLGVLFT